MSLFTSKYLSLTSYSLIFCLIAARASGEMLDLKHETEKLKTRILYDGKLQIKDKSDLYLFKEFAVEKKSSECEKHFNAVWNKYRGIQGWIALNLLQCFADGEKINYSHLQSKFIVWEKSGLLKKGPWASELRSRVLSITFDYLDTNSSEKTFQWLVQQWEALSPSQKAKWHAIVGKLAFQKKDFIKALFHFDISKKLDARLVPETDYQKAQDAVGISKSASKAGSSTIAPAAVLSATDIENLNDSDLLKVDFKIIQDRIENLHRRGDYTNAIKLAETVIRLYPPGVLSVDIYWVLGRSLQFTGKYDKALETFSLLEVKWPSSKEASEAQFRRGLIFYRLKNYVEAQKIFLSIKNSNSDRYDLLARYWNIRSLQKIGGELSTLQQFQTQLVQKYPWSYYGLRIQSELNSGKWSFLEAPNKGDSTDKLLSKIWLEGEELASFHRVKLLVENGMQEEALLEIKNWPSLNRAQLNSALSNFYQSAGLWLPSIIQLNAAQELEANFLAWDFQKRVFPKPYIVDFEKAAQENSLPVELILSLTRQESGFNSRAVSTSNALGLMQMIPPTAKDVATKLKLKLQIPQDVFHPPINIKMGASYLAEVIKQFDGSVPLGLAGYNAGPHKVKKWMESRDETKVLKGLMTSDPDTEIWMDELPWSETSFYVKAILRNWAIYKIINWESLNKSDAKKIRSGIDLGPVWWSDIRPNQ